jgi:hypothetical protein
MNVKMKSLLKENRIYFQPLNKLLSVIETSNSDLVSIFNALMSYKNNPKYYEGKEYESEINALLILINKIYADNKILLSKTQVVIRKTKEINK